MSIETQRAEFNSKGYVVIDDFLSSSEVRQILESIEAYQAAGREVVQVDQKSLIRTQIFKTIVGDDCEKHIALFRDLWRNRILELSKERQAFVDANNTKKADGFDVVVAKAVKEQIARKKSK